MDGHADKLRNLTLAVFRQYASVCMHPSELESSLGSTTARIVAQVVSPQCSSAPPWAACLAQMRDGYRYENVMRSDRKDSN